MNPLSDSSLFGLVKTDNHMAYTVLIDRYWQDLYRHIFLKIRDENDAKDIVQDIFLGLWKNRSTIHTDEKDSLAPYLFTAAKYAIINRFSRANVAIINDTALLEALQVASGDRADDSIMASELQQLLNTEVNNLPERFQTAYRLSREQELSIKEIALKLAISEQTVKNNITSALGIIRLKLSKYQSDSTVPFIIVLSSFLHTR